MILFLHGARHFGALLSIYVSISIFPSTLFSWRVNGAIYFCGKFIYGQYASYYKPGVISASKDHDIISPHAHLRFWKQFLSLALIREWRPMARYYQSFHYFMPFHGIISSSSSSYGLSLSTAHSHRQAILCDVVNDTYVCMALFHHYRLRFQHRVTNITENGRPLSWRILYDAEINQLY